MPGMVPPVHNERDALVSYLDQQRGAVRISAYGLSDEQIRLVPTPSALSVGAVLKHLSAVERYWTDLVLGTVAGGAADYEDNLRCTEVDTAGGLLDAYARATARTDGVVASVADLGQDVPVPKGVPWFPGDVDAWSVRWVVLHLIEETARHAGHADIVREAVDGATAFPLMAAAEGWPPTPWMRPWTSPTAGSEG